MSDELEGQEPKNDDAPKVEDKHANLRGLDEDDYIQIIEKTRAEAANRRLERKSKTAAEEKIAEDAKKWQEHLNSQKSATEKLSDEARQLQAELDELRLEKLQRSIADEFELDPDLVEFVTGSNETEMRAKAKKLAEREAKVPGSKDLRGGARGRPVVPKINAGGQFLQHLGDNL
jgi:hypothetical protein